MSAMRLVALWKPKERRVMVRIFLLSPSVRPLESPLATYARMPSDGACQLRERPQLRAYCPVDHLQEFLSGDVALATIEDRSEGLLEQACALAAR